MKIFAPAYLNTSLWDSINTFCAKAGARLVFNMNYFQYMRDGGHNLRNLLEYSIARNILLTFYRHVTDILPTCY